MEKRTFDSFTYDEIEYIFSIKRVETMPVFETWLQSNYTITDVLKNHLVFLQKKLKTFAEAWNEDELKLFFIGPLLVQADLYSEVYKPFTQRNLKATFPENNLEIHGKVEFMLAQGKVNPRVPFFFLHEYKQERRRETDPLAQVLIAMLAARQHNKHDYPDYGCYVVGRYWYFIVFDGSEYVVSPSYDATKDEIFDIFNIICGVKEIAKTIFK
jgi:hypothetical protein